MPILKFIIILFAFLEVSINSVAHAQNRNFNDEEIRARTRSLDFHSSLVIGQADIALTTLSELIARVDLEENEAHIILGRTVKRLDGVRAIVFIASDGKLTYDSFSNPVPNINLSSRTYFMEAIKTMEGQLIIGEPVKGNTSGIPFLPVAKAVWKDGKPYGVLAAIITPSALLVAEDTQDCLHCVAMITGLSGKIIAKYPEGVELSQEFKDKLDAENLPVKGTEIIQIGLLKAKIYWIRKDKYPLISIFLEFIQG